MHSDVHDTVRLTQSTAKIECHHLVGSGKCRVAAKHIQPRIKWLLKPVHLGKTCKRLSRTHSSHLYVAANLPQPSQLALANAALQPHQHPFISSPTGRISALSSCLASSAPLYVNLVSASHLLSVLPLTGGQTTAAPLQCHAATPGLGLHSRPLSGKQRQLNKLVILMPSCCSNLHWWVERADNGALLARL